MKVVLEEWQRRMSESLTSQRPIQSSKCMSPCFTLAYVTPFIATAQLYPTTRLTRHQQPEWTRNSRHQQASDRYINHNRWHDTSKLRQSRWRSVRNSSSSSCCIPVHCTVHSRNSSKVYCAVG